MNLNIQYKVRRAFLCDCVQLLQRVCHFFIASVRTCLSIEVRTVASFFSGLRLKRPNKRNCFKASRHPGAESTLGKLRHVETMFSFFFPFKTYI